VWGPRRLQFRPQLRELIRTLSIIRGGASEPASAASPPTTAAGGADSDDSGGSGGSGGGGGPMDVDAASLQTLLDMGYAEAVARKALLLNRCVLFVACNRAALLGDPTMSSEPAGGRMHTQDVADGGARVALGARRRPRPGDAADGRTAAAHHRATPPADLPAGPRGAARARGGDARHAWRATA